MGTSYLSRRKNIESEETQGPSVRPHMDKAMCVAGIDLITFFIVEESSDVFKGFSNSTSSPRSSRPLLRTAISATITAFVRRNTVGCPNFSEAFSS